MTNDAFGFDLLTDWGRYDTTNRPHDGIYTGLGRSSEPSMIADLLARPGHACGRLCPEHGDLSHWQEARDA